MMRSRAAAAIGLFVASIAPIPVMAQTSPPINVNVFPGTNALPAYICVEKGFCEAAGVPIKVVHTSGSSAQMSDFLTGKSDVVFTLIDNIFAYQGGQASIPEGTKPDIAIIMGLSYTEINFITLPEIKSWNDLKGRKVAVDNVSTGLSLLIKDHLSRAGLKPDEYQMVSVGGGNARNVAMAEGKAVGAALTPPFLGQALARGYTQMKLPGNQTVRYEGLVVAVQRPWAKANEQRLTQLTGALVKSFNWLLDSSNRVETANILRKNLPQLSIEEAQAGVEGFVTTATHSSPDIDMEAAKIVLNVRQTYGEPNKQLPAIETFIDRSYLTKVNAIPAK
jgi:ABC-type nitrate/sulfonate/bicarbonate transport system substrate-binding protein